MVYHDSESPERDVSRPGVSHVTLSQRHRDLPVNTAKESGGWVLRLGVALESFRIRALDPAVWLRMAGANVESVYIQKLFFLLDRFCTNG
jgi:hypothetical protein